MIGLWWFAVEDRVIDRLIQDNAARPKPGMEVVDKVKLGALGARTRAASDLANARAAAGGRVQCEK